VALLALMARRNNSGRRWSIDVQSRDIYIYIYIYIDDIVAATGETGHRNIVAVISKASHRNTVGIEFCNRCK